MIEQIDQLIDAKLLLLFHSEHQVLLLHDFKKTPKSTLGDARILAEMMQGKDLIRLLPKHEMHYELTTFGIQVCQNGGWLRYLENLKVQNNKNSYETLLPQATDKRTSLTTYLKSVLQAITLHKNR